MGGNQSLKLNRMSESAETEALRELIKFAILSDPHNQSDILRNIEEESQLEYVIEFMSTRGYRPVTVDEIREERVAAHNNKGVGYNITVST